MVYLNSGATPHTRPSFVRQKWKGQKMLLFKIGRDETTQLKWGRKYLMFDVKTATLARRAKIQIQKIQYKL